MRKHIQTAMINGTKGIAVNPDTVTVETLHRRGIHVAGFSQQTVSGQKVVVVQFCHFSIHHLTVPRMCRLLDVCRSWAKELGDAYEPQLVFCCTASAERGALKRELYRVAASGEPYWKNAFKSVIGYHSPRPFLFSNICEQERYFPVIP